MSRSRSLELLVPRYVGRFTCIGGECEDTCCSGWQVDLDPETDRAYRACPDPVLRPLFARHLSRKEGQRGGSLIQADRACWDCPFLTERKRCLIQERMGHEALSDTCAGYPRESAELAGLPQMTLSLACPEAARLALLAEDAFELEVQAHPIRSGTTRRPTFPKGLDLEGVHEVRTTLIQVLQARELDLGYRLRVVGLLCERLGVLLREGRFAAIPDLARGLEEALGRGTLARGPEAFRARPEVQAQLVGVILRIRQVERLSGFQARIMEEVVQGLGDPEGLRQGVERLAHALEAVPWLLDHYLLNEALSELMPWGEADPMAAYAQWVLKFAILRVMLAGRATVHSEVLTPGELSETVQVFGRRYLHSEEFKTQMTGILEGSGWHRLENLYMLI